MNSSQKVNAKSVWASLLSCEFAIPPTPDFGGRHAGSPIAKSQSRWGRQKSTSEQVKNTQFELRGQTFAAPAAAIFFF